jgi:hypothetical protein
MSENLITFSRLPLKKIIMSHSLTKSLSYSYVEMQGIFSIVVVMCVSGFDM